MRKSAIVLEGGGNRGIFTAGVLDYLMEQDLYTDYVIGVSAGACNAVDYVSRQIGRSKIAMKGVEGLPDAFGLRSVIKNHSYMDMEMLFHDYPYKHLPFDFDTFFGSSTKFEAVVTNCLTGKAEYLSEGSDHDRLLQIVRASSSLPFVSPMVKIDQIPYFDGGLADAVPIKHALTLGYKRCIVILTRQKGYRKKVGRASLRAGAVLYQKYPELVRTMKTRESRYNKTIEFLERQEAAGHIFVMRPETVTVGRTEKDKDAMELFYKQGYDSMKVRYQALLNYLGRKE